MQKSNKYYALAATLLFHIGVLLLLMYTYLTTPTPPMGSGEPVLVNIGYADMGSGDEQPMSENVTEEPIKTKPTPPEEPEEEVIKPVTSEVEESIKIEEKKEKKTVKKKKEEKKPEEVKVEPKKEEPKKEPEPPKVNEAAIYKGPKTKSKSEGDDKAGTEGDKGVKDGGLNSKVYSGPSGNGDGGDGGSGKGKGDGPGDGDIGNKVIHNLQGRKLLKAPPIKEKTTETGKIVVAIVVDKNGVVTKATAGARGSTITNAELYRSTEEAAMKAKFDASEDSPEDQRGTITFKFILK